MNSVMPDPKSVNLVWMQIWLDLNILSLLHPCLKSNEFNILTKAARVAKSNAVYCSSFVVSCQTNVSNKKLMFSL